MLSFEIAASLPLHVPSAVSPETTRLGNEENPPLIYHKLPSNTDSFVSCYSIYFGPTYLRPIGSIYIGTCLEFYTLFIVSSI